MRRYKSLDLIVLLISLCKIVIEVSIKTIRAQYNTDIDTMNRNKVARTNLYLRFSPRLLNPKIENAIAATPKNNEEVSPIKGCSITL